MIKKVFVFSLLFLFLFALTAVNFAISEDDSLADKGEKVAKKIPIEVNGDTVEFLFEGKTVVAEGNVEVVHEDSKLLCDKVTVNTETKVAVAEGNVRLYSPKGNLVGERMEYNFEKNFGTIINADVAIAPYYVHGDRIERVSENEMVIKNGYMTTSDLDNPHYRFTVDEISIVPDEKISAKDAKFLIGKVPVLWLPKYTHRLDENRPKIRVIPGKDKDWGIFFLTSWRFYLADNVEAKLHVDYRERKDVGSGLDLKYETGFFGEGILRTYYMNERAIEAKRLYKKIMDEEGGPTSERERFRIQLRHYKEINDTTDITMELNKMSDIDFLEDYYYKEYEKDIAPKSYFLLKHYNQNYTLSLLSQKRLNRFYAEVEKLPELKLETVSRKIGNSPVYFKSTTSAAYLTDRQISPTDMEDSSTRIDTFNKFSIPKKIGFIETNPYVGYRATYYGDTKENGYEDVVRGAFYSGIDLSTKFYKIFEVESDFMGMDIKRLRHVFNPAINYSYIHPPSVPYTKLHSFDGIDSLEGENKFTIQLDNKLQTKRNGKSVDLVRHTLTSDHVFSSHWNGKFEDLRSDLEFRPNDWLRFDNEVIYGFDEARYGTKGRYVKTVNTDLYTFQDDDWSIGVGHRYERKFNKQLTAELSYKINPKWRIRAYERFEFDVGDLKEQEYTIYRDLHSWSVELSFNQTRGEGSTIWLVFRIKAFPETGFEINKSYNGRKTGSQSSEQ